MADPQFNSSTPLIKIEGNPDYPAKYEVEVGTYPRYFTQVFGRGDSEFPNVMPGTNIYQRSEIALYGYAPVYSTDQPAGDVITEGKPKQGDDGLWYQTWEVRPFNDEELAANLEQRKAELNQRLSEVQVNSLAEGIPHTFTVDGNEQVLHVAVDNGERGNVVALGFQAHYRVEKNLTDVISLRTIEGQIFDLAPAEMYDLVYDVLSKYQGVLDQVWILRNEISAATDLASLPTIPDTLTNSEPAKPVEEAQPAENADETPAS